MTNPSAPPRPYTSYNLFFQLEREYILQALLGHTPTLAPEEVFDPSADSYPSDAPSLPTRYADLILPSDWHVPGKARRRKRVHRKTHGKIGFHELNDRISKAWSEADDEVREFCGRLADIEAIKYRRARRKAKRDAKARKATPPAKEVGGAAVRDGRSPSFDWTPSIASPATSSDPPLCRLVSDEGAATPTPARVVARPAIHEVDMTDSEILRLWQAAPLEEAPRAVPEAAFDISRDPQVLAFLSGAQLCVDAMKRGTVDERKSHIDAEYAKFKELGQAFLRRRRRMPAHLNSVTAPSA